MYANSCIATGHILFGSGLGMDRREARCRGASVIALPLASFRERQRSLMTQSPNRLSDLWLQRGSLSGADTAELFQRVVASLRQSAARICGGLSLKSPEEFVWDFAQDNVYEVDLGKKSAFLVEGENETKAYIKRRFEMSMSDIRRAELKGPEINIIDDPEPEPPAPSEGDDRSIVEILAARGLALEVAVDHASRFVGDLHCDEKIFLFYNTCMDYDDKRAEREHGKAAVPLVELAARFAIKNYYRKARALGITGLRGGFVKDFAKSKLGRFMQGCGLKIDRDHWDEMKAMLKILCGVVFDCGFENKTK